jgi:peptidoglycan/LPS O-acetylase OafA/YrhL
VIGLTGIRFLFWISGLNYDPWSYRFFPFELPMFILGILLYRIRKSGKIALKLSTTKISTIGVFAYLVFGVVLERMYIARVFQLAFLTLITAVIVLCSERNNRDSKIGELSYPFYLTHILVLSSYWNLLDTLDPKSPFAIFFGKDAIQVLIILLVTLLASVVLIRIVRPIERLRDKNRAEALNN